MRVAEILSDLTSLRATSDIKAALGLVTARPDNIVSSNGSNEDADLQRVKDLIELHSKVKVTQSEGIDHDLKQARETVSALARQLS